MNRFLWIFILVLFCLVFYLQRPTSYGFSLWYIPTQPLPNWSSSHLPHITVQSFFSSVSSAQQAFSSLPTKVVVIPQPTVLYWDQPGYAQVVRLIDQNTQQPISISSVSHLSFSYQTRSIQSSLLTIPFESSLCIADTRSTDPAQWKIVYRY